MIRLLSLPMIVSSWTSFLLAAFFLVFAEVITRRSEDRPRHYRLFALMAFLNGVFLGAFSLLINSPTNLDILDASNRVTILAATFTIAVSIDFFAAFFCFDPPLPRLLVYGLCGIFSVLCLVPSDLFLQKAFYQTCSYYMGLEFGPLFQVWGIFVVLLSLYGLGILIGISRGKLGNRTDIDRRMVVVLIGASFLWLLTAMADCLTGVQMLDLPPLAWLGSFFTTVAIAGVLMSHIDELYRDKGTLYQELIHDHLTGAFSRSYFELRLGQAVRRIARNPDSHAQIVMLDIDDFKSVNDTCGHPVGDRVLQEIVAALGRDIRESDTVARIGGDEFAMLLMDVEHESEALTVVERVRQQIGAIEFEHRDMRFSVTCSFGMTKLSSDLCKGRAPEDFTTAADDALYEAKNAGKNTLRTRYLSTAPEASAD